MTRIALANSTGQAIPMGEAYKLVDGTICRKFLRPVARVGDKYTKPSWAGVPNDEHIKNGVLYFSSSLAAEVLGNIKEMQSDGLSVKSTMNHTDWGKAENTLGDVPLNFLDTNGVFQSLHEIRGQKNIEIAEANRGVSMDLVKNYTHNGKTYKGWTIPAISFVGNPLAPNPERLAASGDDMVILTLQTSQESEMKTIALALGLNESTSEAVVLAAVESLKTKAANAETKLSLSITPESHAEVLETRRESVSELMLSLDTQFNAVSPAVAKELASLAGTKEKPNRLMLSRGDDNEVFLKRIYAILKDNKIVKDGKKSGEQVRIAAGAAEEEKDKEKPLTKDRRNELREKAGLAPVA